MMTVAELIAILQTMPQDIPVTGYCSDETAGFISVETIKLEHSNQYYRGLRNQDDTDYVGQYVMITGDWRYWKNFST